MHVMMHMLHPIHCDVLLMSTPSKCRRRRLDSVDSTHPSTAGFGGSVDRKEGGKQRRKPSNSHPRSTQVTVV